MTSIVGSCAIVLLTMVSPFSEKVSMEGSLSNRASIRAAADLPLP